MADGPTELEPAVDVALDQFGVEQETWPATERVHDDVTGIRQIQLVEAAIDHDALGVEGRSHGSIAHDGRSS